MSQTVQTSLVQMPIKDMSQAVSVSCHKNIFGTKRSDGKLPLVLVPSRGKLSFYMIIPDGCHVLMQAWGKEVPLSTPGLKILPPWYRVAFLVSRQSNAYDAPIQFCPTQDNVMVHVDLTLVFRIDDAKKFVYELGALKFDALLKAATEESIRGLVRATPHDKVYELRGSKAGEFLGSLNEKFQKFGVSFSDATITNVMLPADLAQTLERETTFESKQKEEEKSHLYNVKIINDKAELEMKQLRAENERLAQDEVAKKQRALIQKGQSEIEAQRKKQLAIIKAEEQAAVMRYKAESELINSKIQGEKEANVLLTRAKAEANAAKIKADQDAQTAEVRSRADVTAAENQSKALLVEAEAEGKSAAMLKDKRNFDLNMQKMQILEQLARSGKIVISGKPGDQLIQQITALGDLSL